MQVEIPQSVTQKVNDTERNLVKQLEWKTQQNKELGEIFEKDYKKYKKILYKLRIPSDRHDDMIQHAYFYALKSHQKIDNIDKCMKTAVFNAGLHFKRNKFEKNRSILAGSIEKYTTATAETVLLKKAEEKNLNSLVNNLSKQQRIAIRLGIMQDLSSKETAKKMNIAPDTAKAHWRLGVINLREKVKTWDIPNTYESEYFVTEEENAY